MRTAGIARMVRRRELIPFTTLALSCARSHAGNPSLLILSLYTIPKETPVNG
jgi:hypothetical protein